MSMRDYERAASLLRRHADEHDFVGAHDERIVTAAETVLGVAFPPTYRRFLLELGAGDVGGEEIYGVITEDFEHSSVPDAIWLTRKLRAEGHLPQDLIVIYSTGDGDYYGLDASQANHEGEYPVVAWSESREVIASDFGAFFLDIVRDALAES